MTCLECKHCREVEGHYVCKNNKRFIRDFFTNEKMYLTLIKPYTICKEFKNENK